MHLNPVRSARRRPALEGRRLWVGGLIACLRTTIPATAAELRGIANVVHGDTLCGAGRNELTCTGSMLSSRYKPAARRPSRGSASLPRASRFDAAWLWTLAMNTPWACTACMAWISPQGSGHRTLPSRTRRKHGTTAVSKPKPVIAVPGFWGGVFVPPERWRATREG